MELELKHLAPYFPYGLKVIRPDGRTVLEVIGIQGFTGPLLIHKEGMALTYSGMSGCKPILRPLSDLTKEIEHNVEKLSPEKILSHLDLEWLITSDNLIMKTNYEDVLKLLEWHFDIFGLIDAGLAIDINQTNLSPSH